MSKIHSQHVAIFLITLFTIFGSLYYYTQQVLAASSAFNKQINYQGKLNTSASAAVADGSWNLKFRLYTVSTGGTVIWEESYTSTTSQITITGGLFSTLLGSVSSLASIDFNQDLYLAIEVGGTTTPAVWDGEMTPRKRLGAVPSAFQADKIDGLDSSQLVRSDDSGTIASSSASTLLALSQTGAGSIFSLANSGGTILTVVNGGNIGIGTTSPYAALSVTGASGVVADKFHATNTTATSTFAGFVSTKRIDLTGNATNTAAQGWNIASGCFAISGTCLTGSGLTGSGASNRTAFWTTSGNLSYDDTFVWDNTNKRLGIGTTSPWGTLGIAGVASQANPLFVVATTTTANPIFIVDQYGKVGIGTTTPIATFEIAGKGDFTTMHVTEEGAPIRFNEIVYSDTAGDEPQNSLGHFRGTRLAPTATQENDELGTIFFLGYDNSSESAVEIRAYADGEFFTSGDTTDSPGRLEILLAPDGSNTKTARFVIKNDGSVGIGTTSPYAALSVVGSTGVVADKFHATNTTATSTFAGFVSTKRIDLTGNATSTAAQGWNITSGCFAVSGTCLTGSGLTGSGASGRVTYWDGTSSLTSSSTFTWDDTNGRLGIGTSSPSLNLDITGQFGVKPTGSGYPTSLASGLPGRFYTVHGNGDFGLVVARAAVDNGGANLALYHTRNTDASTKATLSDADALGRITFQGASSASTVNVGAQIQAFVNGTISDGVLPTDLAFYTATSGNATTVSSEKLRITSSGLVGIGTTSPYAALSIVGSTGVVADKFHATNTTATSTFAGFVSTKRIDLTGNATSTAAQGWNITSGCFAVSGTCLSSSAITGSGAADRAAFWTTSGNLSYDDTFVWDNTNKRLGLGTTSPYAALSVVGSTGVVADNFSATNTVATSTFMGSLVVATTSPPSNVIFSAGVTGGSFLVVDKFTGNVGIGTTTPAGTFSVNGTVFMKGLTAASGTVNAVCVNTGGRLTQNAAATDCVVSSLRYKRDLRDLNVGLDLINKFKPRSYYYKEDDLGTEHIGFIAEEVDLIEPRLVAHLEDGRAQTVRYVEIIPILTKAIQELDAKIESGSGVITNVDGETLWQISAGGSLQSALDVNLAGHVLLGVDSIKNAAGNWSIDGDGVIRASKIYADIINTKEFCIDDLCITRDEFRSMLTSAGIMANELESEQESDKSQTSTPSITVEETPSDTEKVEDAVPDPEEVLPVEETLVSSTTDDVIE